MQRNNFIINFIASFLSALINYCIFFFFTPYIVNVVGAEAFGFVGLANNMVNYATIVTIALNSVAGRFITINVHSGNDEKANAFYNATIWANVFIAIVLCIIALPIIFLLDKIISIPLELVSDVKLLFTFVFVNFIITIITTIFTVATFITNKLYLTNIGNCIAAVLRVLLLVCFFGIFPTNIAYISITSTICTIFLAGYNYNLTQKLVPTLKINYSLFSVSKVRTLVSSGIWNSFTKLSQILSDGLDLLICNIWISAYAMGQLAIAYTIPTVIANIIGIMTSLFTPQQTYYYAKGDITNVVRQFKTNMKLNAFFVSNILSVMVIYGKDFFKLWTPNENINLIYVLSIFSIISVLISGVTSSLQSVFLLTNNLKINSLFWFSVSVVDSILILLFVTSTNYGIYAVAGVSKLVGFCGNLLFTPIYASMCLKISKWTFYPIVVKYFCEVIILIIVFATLKVFVLPDVCNWRILITNLIILGSIGCGINFSFFLNKAERLILVNSTIGKISKYINK